MATRIDGSGTMNFLQTAEQIQKNSSPDVDDTVRFTKDKGLYTHSGIKAILAGFKNMFRGADSQHMKDRRDKIQAGAQKLFDSMQKSYGSTFAEFAFNIVGAGDKEC